MATKSFAAAIVGDAASAGYFITNILQARIFHHRQEPGRNCPAVERRPLALVRLRAGRAPNPDRAFSDSLLQRGQRI